VNPIFLRIHLWMRLVSHHFLLMDPSEWWPVAGERAYYDQLFAVANSSSSLDPLAPSSGSLSRQEAVQFLAKSGLEIAVLKEIWNISHTNDFFLRIEDFYVSMRLLSLAQNGQPVTKESLAATSSKQFPMPEFNDASLPLAPLVYSYTSAEKERYDRVFKGVDTDNDGFILGGEAVALFTKSGLDNAKLRMIWALSDVDKDNKLNPAEFAIAMHLIVCATKRRMAVPDKLPAELAPNGTDAELLHAAILQAKETEHAAMLQAKDEEWLKQKAEADQAHRDLAAANAMATIACAAQQAAEEQVNELLATMESSNDQAALVSDLLSQIARSETQEKVLLEQIRIQQEESESATELVASNSKFVAPALILGQPVEIAYGLKKLLGVNSQTIGCFMMDGMGAIQSECEATGQEEDKRNLQHILAGTQSAGWESAKSIDELMAHSSSKLADLERHHIVALRLYTSSSFKTINDSLRKRVKPHPLPATTFFISEALKLLNAVSANKPDANSSKVSRL
jgi:hypothetical protein